MGMIVQHFYIEEGPPDEKLPCKAVIASVDGQKVLFVIAGDKNPMDNPKKAYSILKGLVEENGIPIEQLIIYVDFKERNPDNPVLYKWPFSPANNLFEKVSPKEIPRFARLVQ